MAKRIRALIEPSMLAWARKASGYSIGEVAAKLKKTPEIIASWERGEDSPYMGQVRKLAQYFRRPISDFYLPSPPIDRPIPHDFRRLPSEGVFNYTPFLRRQLRYASENRELALDLYRELNEEAPTFSHKISLATNPEVAGNSIRDMLRISFNIQRSWRDDRVAYNAWRSRIDELGLLVFQFDEVSPREVWGFSFAEPFLPVIGINKKLSPNGRTFTMLHELVHILIGKSSVCDIDDSSPRGQSEIKIEVFCNKVAAATLMPKDLFINHEVIISHQSGRIDWDDNEINNIAQTFGASREATVIRLKTFKLTNSDFYLQKRQQYHDERIKNIERSKIRYKEKPLKRNMPREAISNLGYRYVNLILSNYHEDRITLVNASEYLKVRAEKVRTVEELMLGR